MSMVRYEGVGRVQLLTLFTLVPQYQMVRYEGVGRVQLLTLFKLVPQCQWFATRELAGYSC